MEDQLNLSMFRAYDIRTPSSLLTPELAERHPQFAAVIAGASLDLVEQAEREIASCVRQFGAGDEYQG